MYNRHFVLVLWNFCLFSDPSSLCFCCTLPLSWSLSVCCFTDSVGNLPGEVRFPSPLSSLPSTFCVVDLRSLCLLSEKSTRAFSATELRQRHAVLPTQKNITAHSQTHIHTHTLFVCMSDDHALASQADWQQLYSPSSVVVTDRQLQEQVYCQPAIGSPSPGLATGQENNQSGIEKNRIV